MAIKDWNIKTSKQKIIDTISALIDETCIEEVEAKSVRVHIEIRPDSKGDIGIWCFVYTGTDGLDLANELFYGYRDSDNLVERVQEYIKEYKENSKEHIARETECLMEKLKDTKKRLKALGVKA